MNGIKIEFDGSNLSVSTYMLIGQDSSGALVPLCFETAQQAFDAAEAGWPGVPIDVSIKQPKHFQDRPI